MLGKLVSLTWPFCRITAEACEMSPRPRTASFDKDNILRVSSGNDQPELEELSVSKAGKKAHVYT